MVIFAISEEEVTKRFRALQIMDTVTYWWNVKPIHFKGINAKSEILKRKRKVEGRGRGKERKRISLSLFPFLFLSHPLPFLSSSSPFDLAFAYPFSLSSAQPDFLHYGYSCA